MENNKEDLNNENKKNELPKDTIIPAYMKKDKVENVEKDNSNLKKSAKKVKNKIDKSKTKKIIVLIVLAVLAIAVVFGIFYGGYILFRKIKYSKYDEYQKQMEIYALSSMYNNEKATSYEKCTKSEAIKLIISSITNEIEIYDSEYNGEEDYKEKYENKGWVEYAYENEIITEDDINEKNANSTVTFIEFVKYYANARVKLLGQSLKTDEELKFKDIKGLKAEEVSVLSDLVRNGVIENSSKKIKPNRKLAKGEVNMYMTKIIKQYNLLIPNGKKFNINKEKEPSNASEYPYILTDVSKDIYEKSFIVKSEETFENPVKVFSYQRVCMSQLMESVKTYYDYILNIDYNTIDKDNMMEVLGEESLFNISEAQINRYITYVKENKIKITGSATPQMPIVYYDGSIYRVRVKIDFKVESSDTKDNLLFMDLEGKENVTYDSNEYSFYIDAKIDTLGDVSRIMYVYQAPINEYIIDENKNITLNKKTSSGNGQESQGNEDDEEYNVVDGVLYI